MNKRYIDFVPVKDGGKGARKASAISTRSTAALSDVSSAEIGEVKARRIRTSQREIVGRKSVSRGGVVTKRTVVKRTATVRPVEKPVEKPVKKTVERKAVVSSPKMNIPQNPFINTNKVSKRPLSKNVYKKEVKAPVEEPKGPVTIIEEPDKKGKIGLIITIIITIILGAAAGTVAFLLLPK